ncbi:tetratricopeptide repeat protein [Acidobacteria bacterium AH-259-L09]|nr:tetratricopeptide repeat protein [Acidobacteria bacterium AH-259-L09]
MNCRHQLFQDHPEYLTALCVAVSVFSFYCFTSLPGGFYYDDMVALPATIHFSLSDFLGYKLMRPLTIFTYFLNYKIAGFSEIIFHLTNITIHAANSALCVLIAFCFLRQHFGAALTGAIFGYHFLVTEAVNYIWARSALLSSFWILLGLFVIARKSDPFKGRKTFVLAAILLLGFLSRADGLLLLPLGYLAIWILEQDKWNAWYSVFLILMIILSAIIIQRLGNDTSAGFDIGFGFKSWCVQALAAIVKYFELIVRPDRGSLFHVNPSLGPSLWVGFLAVLIIGTLLVWKRGNKPVLYGGLVLFVCVGFVVAVPILQAVAERRVYLAVFGLALMIASLAMSAVWKYRVVFCIILATWMVAPAVQRNREWSKPPQILWRAEELYPNAEEVQYLLASYFESIDPKQSEVHYSKAIRLNPDFPNLHYNVGTLYMQQGRWEEAEHEFQEELRRNPRSPDSLNNLGIVYAQKGQVRKAISLFRRVLQLQPEHERARLNLKILSRSKSDQAKQPAPSDKRVKGLSF